MRRKDRETDKDFALKVADSCVWASIAMIDTDGMPYNVPVHIVREGDNIYFHCAKEGFKTDCLKNNGNVCIVCVDNVKRIPERFTTEYQSATIRGVAEEVADDDEKIHILKILCERHVPTGMNIFDAEIKRNLSHTAIWKIRINDITGKCNKLRKEN